MGLRAAIAKSPVPGPPFPWLTFLGNLPSWLPVCIPRQEEHTSTRRACQTLSHVRRLVLRHCGRLDWEVHSVLFQPHLSFLCRVAQVEVYLVRGVGPTHSLLGPFLSMTPEINYPCACGEFLSLENSGWIPKSHTARGHWQPLVIKQAASGAQELVRFSRGERGPLLAFQC